jgi:hypothetical protein
MKPPIRLLFTDFWTNFSPKDFWLTQLLAEEFEIRFDESNPELLIFCGYGIKHLNYKCHKISYSHENSAANPKFCDYSFGFQGRGANYQYFPNFVEDRFFEQVRSNEFSAELQTLRASPKTKFCNFVYSNGKAKERIKFCQSLAAYKRVDCPGEVLNNQPPFDANAGSYCAGGAADKKTAFLKQYKFTIAFENESAPNYTTEKILHAFVAGSIPIYWGNPNVGRLFNPKSFINCHDFANFADVIELVKEIDRSDEFLTAYQQAQPILPDSPLALLSTDFLRSRLREIAEVALTRKSISQRRSFPVRKWSHFIGTKLRNRTIYTGQRIQEFFTGQSSRIAWKSRLTNEGIKP